MQISSAGLSTPITANNQFSAAAAALAAPTSGAAQSELQSLASAGTPVQLGLGISVDARV